MAKGERSHGRHHNEHFVGHNAPVVHIDLETGQVATGHAVEQPPAEEDIELQAAFEHYKNAHDTDPQSGDGSDPPDLPSS